MQTSLSTSGWTLNPAACPRRTSPSASSRLHSLVPAPAPACATAYFPRAAAASHAADGAGSRSRSSPSHPSSVYVQPIAGAWAPNRVVRPSTKNGRRRVFTRAAAPEEPSGGSPVAGSAAGAEGDAVGAPSTAPTSASPTSGAPAELKAPAAAAPVAATAPAAVPVAATASPPAPPSTSSSSRSKLEQLKVALLAALSSLDRGLAANAREAAEVDSLCSRLEALGGPVFLTPLGPGAGAAAGSSAEAVGTDATAALSAGAAAGSPGSSLDLLTGTWRLVYSSGFNSGSLGGRRPGPPAALFPTVLGQVYQRIDPATAHLDNIVELLLSYGPPDLGLGTDLLAAAARGAQALGLDRGVRELMERAPGGGLRPEQLPAPLREVLEAAEGRVPGESAGAKQQQWRESPAARLTLRHDYEVTLPATVRIVYEETFGELVGSDLFSQLPRLEAPSLPEPLRPPKFLRSATFDVTFLDSSLRITRGDRGELRVYLRDDQAGREAALGLVGAGAGGKEAAAVAAALDYVD